MRFIVPRLRNFNLFSLDMFIFNANESEVQAMLRYLYVANNTHARRWVNNSAEAIKMNSSGMYNFAAKENLNSYKCEYSNND